MRNRMFFLSLALFSTTLAACAGNQDKPGPQTPDSVTTGSNDEGQQASRPSITAAACEEQGGTVVGDIGDGAIHRPDYQCPGSGAAPLGTIAAEAGGPIGVEGSVCCK